ncbi:hypothetical protein [Rubritalea tangerina]|uniref:hypothetical protein n=1 Tax=Rubritalea tangerina TaxID=430798 RepID=UPI0036102278
MPLQAQIYRQHYPSRVRGRLSSTVGMIRAAVAASFGYFAGLWLLDPGCGLRSTFLVFSVANLGKLDVPGYE